MKDIYLDNGGTTQLDPKVLDAMLPYFTIKFGNSSSIHKYGREANEALEKSRTIIAKAINANPKEIIFTSGGTESNNFAIKGIAFANKDKGNHIITTKIEHKSVINTCKWLEQNGFKITYLDVDKNGYISLPKLQEAITPRTILVSVMHGNNEIGTINDIDAIARLCKKNKVYFHSDACQSFTKVDIDVKNIDLLTLNAHKIHGPKGVGCLYIKDKTKIQAWQHGGTQENEMRSGTMNIHGIVGFAVAVKQAEKKHIPYMKKLRDKLIKELTSIEDVMLSGPKERLCNNVNLMFKDIPNESLGGHLDKKNIYTSAGSACSAKSSNPSHVLKAIGLSDDDANSSIRLTISKFTKEDEIDYVIKTIQDLVKKLRKKSFLDKVVDFVSKK